MHLLEICVSNKEKRKDYPFSIPLFQKGFKIKLSPITLIVGENGVGKSTFLESLAKKLGFPISGGRVQHAKAYEDLSFILNYHKSPIFREKSLEEALAMRDRFSQTDNLELAKNISLVWSSQNKKGAFIRSETFATMVNLPMFSSASNMSHGEGLIDVVANIIDDGIYILDEPEAGLSPLKVIELMALLQEKQKVCKAQFILSTHSPILMLLPDAKVLNISEGEIKQITPQETSHFQLTKQILNNSEDFIKRYFN